MASESPSTISTMMCADLILLTKTITFAGFKDTINILINI